MPASKIRLLWLFCLTAFILTSGSVICSAQQITGSVTGTVTDSSSAPVAGVEVQLTNTATGVAQSATSDEAGNFRFLLLPSGTYSLQATFSGFKKFVREGIVVEVDRSVAIPVSMEVGQVTETVEVRGGSPLLDPNTSSVGTVMDQRKVVDLPLNGRNPMGLANLIPTVRGIGYFGGQVLSSWRMAAVTIGGGQPLSNGFLLDGVVNDKMGDAGPMTFLTVDSTEEFKVQTNGMSAEFGRTSGGVISMISRGGGNEIHGSLFEFLRNDKLNANDFFANKANRARPPSRVNQFGGTIGGPIRKEKLFYFFNYEGYRERTSSLQTFNSPTAAERSGDFSALRTTGSNPQPVIIYDPATTVRNADGTFTRQAFPGNRIPSNRINPIATNMLSYLPLPNLPGSAANLFLLSPTPIDKDYYSVRIDYYISQTRRLAGRFTKDNLDWQFANFFNSIADADGRKILIPRENAFLSYSDTLAPTLLLDGRIGFSHQTEAFTTPSEGLDITTLGFPASLLQQSQSTPSGKQGLFPSTTVADMASMATSTPSANHTVSGTGSATLTKIFGQHTWKGGYEFRLYRSNVFGVSSPVGAYTFTRAFTQGPNPDQSSPLSGYGPASLLLGLPASATASVSAPSTTSMHYNALFFQDDWKASRNLTLNLGLRWEKESAPTDRFNNFSNFDPDVASPLTVPGLSLKGGLVYPGVNGRDRGFFASSNKNFQPRLGLAYQLNPKTVIRAAYGISFVPTTQNGYTGSAIGFSSTTPMVTSLDGGRTPANTLSDPFPTGLNQPTGNSLGAGTAIGTSLTAALHDINRGYSQQWNFTAQHQPFADWLFELGYVGNRGVHLFMYNQNLNWLPDSIFDSYGSRLGNLVPNPFSGIITSGPLAAAQIPQAQLLLPYPQFTALPGSLQGGVVTPFSYVGDSIYHAFTLKVEKRFSRGLSFLGSYSFSKLIDVGDNVSQIRPGGVTGGLIQNWSNLRSERSQSVYNVPQRLVLTGLWEVPLGRSGNAFYRAVAGGWQLNAIATMQSGSPIPLSATVVGGGRRPNVVPGATSALDERTIERWFNTAAFSAPAPYTYGNVSRTLPDVLSDGLFNTDFSIFKNFAVKERYRFQFRAEAFNVTNTPTFDTPGATFGSLTFGQVTATAFYPRPRVVQFGLRMQF